MQPATRRILAALVLAAGLSLDAQAPTQMLRTADPDWEVATVKPSDPNDTRGQHINMPGHHVLMIDTTVEQFLLMGYGVQKVQLANLPDWARTERWDVDGIPDTAGSPNWAQLQSLMRKLLAERFGMVLHHEQRPMSVYALTVGKGAPKITLDTSDPNGLLEQHNGESNGQHFENIKNISMQDFAMILQFHVDRPVLDQTGLKGRYDLKLKWQKDETQNSDPDAPPGLFTAIQEQLGLKLSPERAAADTLVIDRLQRADAN